jgi:hypothetical protein
MRGALSIQTTGRRLTAPQVLAALLLTAGELSGTARAADTLSTDPVVLRGLTHTTKDRGLVEAAINRANLLLATTSRNLIGSWHLASNAGAGDKAVPVYLVAAPAAATSTPAAVPRGCTCVFVNPSLFAAWVKTHTEGASRLRLDVSYLLTFMLLHEVAHITQRTAAGDFSNGELSQLNIEPSLAKANEEDADEFAAGLVRQYSQQLSGSAASLAASWVAMELTKLSWNMQAYRTLDEFGASSTGKPSVFFDQAYSHPNLAWRVLRSNYLIQQSPETKQLLDAFEEARQRGSSRQPLYPRAPND